MTRKSPLGLFAGRVLNSKKKKQRRAISTYKRRKLGIDKKSDPLGGAPQGRGIVLEKVGIAGVVNDVHRWVVQGLGEEILLAEFPKGS